MDGRKPERHRVQSGAVATRRPVGAWSHRRVRCVDHRAIVCHRLTYRTVPCPTSNRGIRTRARWCPPSTGSLRSRSGVTAPAPVRHGPQGCGSQPNQFFAQPWNPGLLCRSGPSPRRVNRPRIARTLTQVPDQVQIHLTNSWRCHHLTRVCRQGRVPGQSG